MQECPEYGKDSLKTLTHYYKHYRCADCNAEFQVVSSEGFGETFIFHLFFMVGITTGFISGSWLAFICISFLLPLLIEKLIRKNKQKDKLKLVGLRAKLKEKGL